jgi:hypothetical protein
MEMPGRGGISSVDEVIGKSKAVAAGTFDTPGDDESHHRILGRMEKWTQHECKYIAVMDASCDKGARNARWAKLTGRNIDQVMARSPEDLFYANRFKALTKTMGNFIYSEVMGSGLGHVGTQKRDPTQQRTEHHLTEFAP